MGLAQSALILLGIGIVSSRFKAGEGLGELGSGISSLVSAPLVGSGTGLSSLAGGIRDLSETFGDLGRGLSDLFSAIPKLPPGEPGNGNGTQLETLPIWAATRLVPDSGGSSSSLLAGGGGNVIRPAIRVAPAPALIEPGYTPPPPDIRLRPTQIYTRNRDIVML